VIKAKGQAGVAGLVKFGGGAKNLQPYADG